MARTLVAEGVRVGRHKVAHLMRLERLTHGLVVVHPLLFALDLDTTDQESLLRSVKEYAEENPDKEWIAGEIWPIGMFPEDAPHRSLLDDIVPDRPVYLLDQSGHSAWLNSKAIEVVGLDDPDIDLDPRAVVVRDESGKATGTIREFAIGYVKQFMPRLCQTNANQVEIVISG